MFYLLPQNFVPPILYHFPPKLMTSAKHVGAYEEQIWNKIDF